MKCLVMWLYFTMLHLSRYHRVGCVLRTRAHPQKNELLTFTIKIHSKKLFKFDRIFTIYIYIPGTCLSSILNPPKEGPFHSKQGSFGFQVHIFYFSLKQMHPQKLGPKIFENFSLHGPPRTVDGSLKSGDHQLRLLVVHLPLFTRVFRHPRWFEIAGFRNEPSTGLVGGFNPFEKDYCIGNFPQIGVKIKNIWVATTQRTCQTPGHETTTSVSVVV